MEEWSKGTCARCAVGCGFRLRNRVDRDGLTVRGDPAHPTNEGDACRRGIEETSNPEAERIEVPLVREGGELVEAGWDRALERAVGLLRDAANANPDSVAILGSGQQTNEAAYLLGRVARGTVGTRNYDANTTLCMASAVAAYYEAFGSDAPPPTYDDIPAAERHVVWGANPAAAHPVMFRWINRSAADPDSELIVVDPVESETAEEADRHVALAPGRDLELARGVLSAVLDRGSEDEAFISEHTTGFESLREDLPAVSQAADRAGVAEETVRALAAAFEHPTLVYWGMGINQSVRGTASAGALIDLCLATGNLGPGTGPFSLTGQSNSMGTRVVSSKGTWPGHRPFGDRDARETVAQTWDVPVERLPDEAGPGPVGIADAAGRGEIDVCWTVATNPVVGVPDATAVESALEDVPLIAQDAFHSETTEIADVVLPAATWGEIEGTLVNMERRVSRVRTAAPAPGKARPDHSIIAEIGTRLGNATLPSTPAEVFAETATLTAGTPADLSGITYDRLDEELAVRWPAPTAEEEGTYRYIEREGWEFPTPSGCARFSDTPAGDLPERANEKYPLTLNTARWSDSYNTGVRTRTGDAGPVPARLHPETIDAEIGGAHADGEGSEYRLTSPRSSVRTVLIEDRGIPLGTVWVPIHHPRTNDLTVPETDPVSDEPNYKQCAVRIEAPS